MAADLPGSLFVQPDPEDRCQRLLPHLRRILAPNPSAMTGPGTNSYLVGIGNVALIDPGPDIEAHGAAIMAALEPEETISHIFVTHSHLDHSALAPHMADRTGAPVLAWGSAAEGRNETIGDPGRAMELGGGEGVDDTFRPDRRLRDGETVDGRTWHIAALHTPGHMSNHLCLAWDGHLFSGDHVMGWSSSLISPPDGDMGDYMRALDRLLTRNWRSLLPGHGAAVAQAAIRIADLRAHRRQRECQIRTALKDGPATAAQIARKIYVDIDITLMPAATRNVLAHMVDLMARGVVRMDPADPGPPFFRIA